MKDIETIKINEVEYVRADSVQVKHELLCAPIIRECLNSA